MSQKNTTSKKYNFSHKEQDMNVDYKAEEKTLIHLFNERLPLLMGDDKLGFHDGMRVQLFVSEIISWFRYSKTLLDGESLSKGQRTIYDLCQEINLEYGFNFTVDNIRKRTFYLKDNTE